MYWEIKIHVYSYKHMRALVNIKPALEKHEL